MKNWQNPTSRVTLSEVHPDRAAITQSKKGEMKEYVRVSST